MMRRVRGVVVVTLIATLLSAGTASRARADWNYNPPDDNSGLYIGLGIAAGVVLIGGLVLWYVMSDSGDDAYKAEPASKLVDAPAPPIATLDFKLIPFQMPAPAEAGAQVVGGGVEFEIARW